MTAEYLPDQPELDLSDSEPRLDFDFMSTRRAYDVDNDLARERRRAFYYALPHPLSESDVHALSQEVFWSAHAAEQDADVSERKQNRAARIAELRFLNWLGDVAIQRNDETAQNAQEVMWWRHGVRGKLGALSLKFRQLVQH